jgi:hypothetical protein
MSKLLIAATGDVKEEHLALLMGNLGIQNCRETVSKRMVLSVEGPSIIEVAGTIISWKTILVASATVFFSTLSKRLAEEIYDNKKILAEVIFSSLLKVARTLGKGILKTPHETYIRVKIAAPKGVPDPSIVFFEESEEEIAFKLACFYAVADQIIEKLADVAEKYEGCVMPPVVTVAENGEVTVKCYAGSSNDCFRYTHLAD